MRRQYAIRLAAVLLPLIATVAFWLWSKTRPGGWDVDVLTLISQIVSLLTLTAFSIVMVIAARNRSIERLYGGLDKSYHLHGRIAKWATVGMLVHPLLLMPAKAMDGIPFYSLLAPVGPWPSGFELARLLGVIGYYGIALLVLLTIYRKVDYQKWYAGHRPMLVFFAAGAVHAFLANSDIRAHEPLRDWMLFVCITGGVAGLYKILAYPWAAQKYRYRVERRLDKGHGIAELQLRPVGARMNYEPGEFAFISVRGSSHVRSEAHPFSIASTPSRNVLRFGIRETGDYTRSLKELKEGDEVMVYGPYGEFTSYMLDEHKRQVWIGGGIGITPFLSMLSHEVANDDPKEIVLIYSAKTCDQLVYDSEIRECLASAGEDKFRYVPHASDADGFLSADKLADLVGDLKEFAFLFCGPPPMMKALKAQLMAKGVPASQIYFEDFSFV